MEVSVEEWREEAKGITQGDRSVYLIWVVTSKYVSSLERVIWQGFSKNSHDTCIYTDYWSLDAIEYVIQEH